MCNGLPANGSLFYRSAALNNSGTGAVMDQNLLSIDLGTSGMKCSIFHPDGRILASASSSYETSYGEQGEAEQDPQAWYAALISCCHRMDTEKPEVLKTLGAAAVSGQMMGAVCLGKDGEPVGPALIHADVRAQGDSKVFPWDSPGQEFEAVYRTTGHRPSPAYSGPKISWIRRNQSERYARTTRFLQPKDYINFRLTGEIYTDASDASGTLLYNLSKRSWDEDMAELFSVELSRMPPILASRSQVGAVTREAAGETGLPLALPIAAGAGDGICAGIGAGSVRSGVAYNYIGTTAWVATSSEEPLYDPSFRVFTFAHAVEGLYHPMGTMQSAGAAVKWLREQLFSNYHSDDIAYRAMDKVLAEASPGSSGLRFLPYLGGERSPWWRSDMRGAWLGICNTTSFADQVRSVYEGISANLAMIARVLDGLSPFSELSLLGGGGLSTLWPQILADAYGKELQVHRDAVSVTSRGAAVIAAVSAGIYPGYQHAADLVKIDKTIKPENSEIMNRVRTQIEDIVRKLYF